MEPLKSALDLHRERFTQRLEQSSAEKERRQEEAWARLDRCPSPIDASTTVVPEGRSNRERTRYDT